LLGDLILTNGSAVQYSLPAAQFADKRPNKKAARKDGHSLQFFVCEQN